MKYEITIPGHRTKIGRNFFARDAETVARDILGRTLVHERVHKATLYARINEVAAWEGNKESIAEETLYSPGTLMVIMRYAKNIFGITTNDLEIPSCITFISATVGDRAGFREYANGPGNLSKALEIDREFNEMRIEDSPIWIGGKPIPMEKILKRATPSKLPKSCLGYFYFK